MMNADNWLLPVPAWISEAATPTVKTMPICGQSAMSLGVATKPLVSVSDCEFPDAIPRLVCTEAPRDPLAVLPQSPVSSSPLLPTPSPQPPRPAMKSHQITYTPALSTARHTRLPTCMEGDNCALARPAQLHSPLDVLARCTPLRAIQLLGGSATRACAAWRAQRYVAPARTAVVELLNDTGIRLERRKRLGSRVAAEHKKAVRAARNRERSQALRRHHKRRLGLLDVATSALNTHCCALRVLVRQLVRIHGIPDTLERALARVPGEELRAFLNSDDHVM